MQVSRMLVTNNMTQAYLFACVPDSRFQLISSHRLEECLNKNNSDSEILLTGLIRITNYGDTFVGGSDALHEFILDGVCILASRECVRFDRPFLGLSCSQFVYENVLAP